MSSSSKQHLKQLLNEDQEPFVLKNYIYEQRSLLNKIPRAKGVQKIKKQNSIRENLCRNVCFFSLQNSSSSPITKSPLFDFSETKTPSCSRNSNTNTVFVHIPARTAALLLEAAVRIQNQSEKQRAAAATAAAASKNNGFFGSILKRLRRRNSKKNDSEFERDNEIKVCVRDILRWESQDVCRNENKTDQEENENEEKHKENTETEHLGYEDKRVSDVGLSSSSGWTESIEAKSMDLETSTSSDEEEDAAESSSPKQPNGEDFYLCEKGSPFRFLLDTVLSPPRRRSPEFMSPATSPNRRKNQVENNVEGSLKKSDGQEEEEKEYCSPVSVLEIQLDDNVDEQDEEEEYEDDSELERSFAFVHKAKQKLLQKLRRFERLAGLDPLDLEKRLTEDEDSNDDDGADEDGDDEEEEDYEEESALNSNGKRSPEDMKKLLLHLMNEEGAVGGASVGNKRCKRLGSLRNAERNMVNMMVEMDFRGEQKEWQRNSEHVEETVVAIEFGIFESLVEELSVELVES